MIDRLGSQGTLVIAGKSMSGRVARMIADELRHMGKISGLLCLGYPFHPRGPWCRLRHSRNCPRLRSKARKQLLKQLNLI
ncbi:alpha/beta family hydrolase [Rhizobium sp. P40RR-XXII]|uniref:alpha/beta family hydrolase n=1 Tax=unclassified Rhizobium TaxID=2613769 RepID=UPI00391809EC